MPTTTLSDPRWTAQPSVTAGLWLVVESGVTPGGIPYCGRVVAECSGPDAERNARIMAGARDLQTIAHMVVDRADCWTDPEILSAAELADAATA